MNNLSPASLSSASAVEPLAPLQDWRCFFDTSSSEASESPSTPLVPGNPSPSYFTPRELPDALVGVSPTQFACGCVSSHSEIPCTAKVCMFFAHHKSRADQAGDPDCEVLPCAESGCPFVRPCITHFSLSVGGQLRSRPSVRARRLAYFALVQRMVEARTLYVPPPMSPCPDGGFSS